MFFKQQSGGWLMNMIISDVGYFSESILSKEASFLSRIYQALFFCKNKTGLADKACKVEEFVKCFLVCNSSKWIVDLRFCTEEFDFIIRFPWLIMDHNYNISISEKVLILMSVDSDVKGCQNVVDKFIDVLWKEFCGCGVREHNIGKIPKEILYLERGGVRYIPRWYIEVRSFLERFRFGCDTFLSWLAAERYFLEQGFQFSQV